MNNFPFLSTVQIIHWHQILASLGIISFINTTSGSLDDNEIDKNSIKNVKGTQIVFSQLLDYITLKLKEK